MLVVAPRDLLLLILINLVWGFNFVASKVAIGEFPPLLFTALRFSVATIALLPFLRVFRGQMGAIVVAALFSGALYFALLFVGLSMTDKMSTAAIASQLGVPFTTLLSIVFLGEVVHWRRWLGIILSFAGIAVIGLDPQAFRSWPGLAVVVLAAFSGSLGLMAVKRLTGIQPLQLQPGLHS